MKATAFGKNFSFFLYKLIKKPSFKKSARMREELSVLWQYVVRFFNNSLTLPALPDAIVLSLRFMVA